MLFDVQDYIEIARWAAELADFTGAGKTNARSIFHPCGNFCLHGALSEDASLAFALRARIRDNASAPFARGTGPGQAEESLLVADLPASSAGAAGGRAFSRRRASTVTFFARLVAPDGDWRFFAEKSFFEFERDVFAQIRAALNPAAAAPASTEKIAKAEELAKDVAEILKYGRIEACTCGRATQSGVAVAVIGGSLVPAGEHSIGRA